MIFGQVGITIHMKADNLLPGNIRHFGQCTQGFDLRSSRGENDRDVLTGRAELTERLGHRLGRGFARRFTGGVNLQFQRSHLKPRHLFVLDGHGLPFNFSMRPVFPTGSRTMFPEICD